MKKDLLLAQSTAVPEESRIPAKQMENMIIVPGFTVRCAKKICLKE
jgi:hypothetical protein